jgi:hydroxyacylglutathione hydrolase
MRNSIERMVALEPESMYLTHYSRIRPPRRLADDVLRRLDAFVRIAKLATEEFPARPVPVIQAAMESYLLSEARQHGITLSGREILEICQIDLELNAEGAAIWAQQLT